MKKIDSKLLSKFENYEFNSKNLIVGGRTSRRNDCNVSSYDDDNSGWRSDSTDLSDTERGTDGCNPISWSSGSLFEQSSDLK